jgi:hypothetical protein
VEKVKAVIGAIGWVIAQLPQVAVLLHSKYYIYQPAVYHDYEWLLVVPLVASAAAMIFALRWRPGWAVLSAIFVVGIGIAYAFGRDASPSEVQLICSWIAFNISASIGIVVVFIGVAELAEKFA